MHIDRTRQAAQVLRTYLVTMGAPDQARQTSAIASLIYAERLNDPPIYPGDPDAIDTVCDRFGDILTDNLDLAVLILADAARTIGVSPAELLDRIVARHLGRYP
jgi:hypothetical protein